MQNCKWCNLVLALIVLIFAIYDGWAYSKWVVIIAAVLLLISSFGCHSCCTGMKPMPSVAKKKNKK